MSTGWTVYFVLVGAVLAFCVWNLICNERTFRHRSRLIEAIFAAHNWQPLERAFRTVPYTKHKWRLVWFRPASEIYPPELRGFLKGITR